jgi:hypothetical protein
MDVHMYYKSYIQYRDVSCIKRICNLLLLSPLILLALPTATPICPGWFAFLQSISKYGIVMPCDLCIAIENATLSGNWILLAMHFLSIGSYFVNVYLEMAEESRIAVPI